MVFVIKHKLHQSDPFEIRLSDLCASLLVFKKDNGDFRVTCGSAHYAFFREPLCYVSPLMKRYIRVSPDKSTYAVPSRFHKVIWLLRSFVYRKFCIIRYPDLLMFTCLLDLFEINYDGLSCYEFFQLRGKPRTFALRVYEEAEPETQDSIDMSQYYQLLK